MTETESNDRGNPNERDEENTVAPSLLNRVLKAVADQRRRQVLYILKNMDSDTISLDALAAELVARDSQFDNPNRARLVLHHQDLAKLADGGFLEYDPLGHRVCYSGDESAENLVEYLKRIEDRDSH